MITDMKEIFRRIEALNFGKAAAGAIIVAIGIAVRYGLGEYVDAAAVIAGLPPLASMVDPEQWIGAGSVILAIGLGDKIRKAWADWKAAQGKGSGGWWGPPAWAVLLLAALGSTSCASTEAVALRAELAAGIDRQCETTARELTAYFAAEADAHEQEVWAAFEAERRALMESVIAQGGSADDALAAADAIAERKARHEAELAAYRANLNRPAEGIAGIRKGVQRLIETYELERAMPREIIREAAGAAGR